MRALDEQFIGSSAKSSMMSTSTVQAKSVGYPIPGIAVTATSASTLAVVPPSEPWLAAKTGKPWGGEDPPQGIVLTANGATFPETVPRIDVQRIAYSSASGYDLLYWTSLPTTVSETFVRGDVEGTLRADLALAWSRTTGTLYAVAGTSPQNATALATLSLYSVVRGLRHVSVGPLTLPLHRTPAAVYSPKDGKLWVLDDQAPVPGAHAWRLLRIDATSGAVYSDLALPSLRAFGRVWLTTLETGEIILVAAPTYDEYTNGISEEYRVVKLDSDRFSSSRKVHFEGANWGLSAYVVTGPLTASDRVTIGLDTAGQPGSRDLRPHAIPSSAISSSFPDFERDLEIANAAP